MALTPKGRGLYDRLLAGARYADHAGDAGADYATRLTEAFATFPDDAETLRREGLGCFRYTLVDGAAAAAGSANLKTLIEAGHVVASPLTYEDFLPVSAAGIFQSNLGGDEQRSYAGDANKTALETSVLDEVALYVETEARSIAAVRAAMAAHRQRAVA